MKQLPIIGAASVAVIAGAIILSGDPTAPASTSDIGPIASLCDDERTITGTIADIETHTDQPRVSAAEPRVSILADDELYHLSLGPLTDGGNNELRPGNRVAFCPKEDARVR